MSMLNKEIFYNTRLKLDSITQGEISQVQRQQSLKVGLKELTHRSKRRSLISGAVRRTGIDKMTENISSTKEEV